MYYKDFKYFGAASSNYVGTDREADSILTLNVDVMWPHRRPRGIQCSWFDSRSGVQSRVLHHWMPLTIDLRDYLNKVWCGTRMPLTGLWPQISIVSPKVWTCVISYFTGWATIPLLIHRDCIQVTNGCQDSEATPCSLEISDGLCFEWSLIIVCS